MTAAGDEEECRFAFDFLGRTTISQCFQTVRSTSSDLRQVWEVSSMAKIVCVGASRVSASRQA